MEKGHVLGFQEMLIPTLQALQQLGGSANINELNTQAMDVMNLSDDMRDVPHGDSGSISEVAYRLAWARTYLKKAGLIDNSSRGVWSFTSNFDGYPLSYNPQEIVREVRSQSSSASEDQLNDDNLDNDGIEQPEEVEDWRMALRGILLDLNPNAFERLTMRLLRESGFTQVEVTGRSNDHGIDGRGIIQLNGLMSFHMLFQCKRYRGKVGPSEIRDFRGAMQGRADKGLFITTGSFTTEAVREATRDGAPAIDLIDGDALIEKLKVLGLGVKERIVKEYEIDKSWFEGL